MEHPNIKWMINFGYPFQTPGTPSKSGNLHVQIFENQHVSIFLFSKMSKTVMAAAWRTEPQWRSWRKARCGRLLGDQVWFFLANISSQYIYIYILNIYIYIYYIDILYMYIYICCLLSVYPYDKLITSNNDIYIYSNKACFKGLPSFSINI